MSSVYHNVLASRVGNFVILHKNGVIQGLKNPFCVPTDKLLGAKDDLLSEGGQSLSSLTEQ